MTEPEQLTDITLPHVHDVLSGRGNFVNHHAGNEHFRSLVKKHKKDYLASPKAHKPMFSTLIYDEIRAMNPPGRFLKQDPSTKLWSDIGMKKALDKTRQALREGAPDMIKGDGDREDNEMKQPKAKKSRSRKGDEPLNSSFASIGSFTVDSAGLPAPNLFSMAANLGQGGNNIPAGILGGNSLQENLMAAQVQLLSQWQKLMSLQHALQNSSTPPDPHAQMQLLNLQMQLQNQMQQQQSLPNLANLLNAQNLANMNQGNNQSLPSFPQFNAPPQTQLDPNIAAMLAVIQNNTNQNNQMQNQNQSFQNFQNQMAMMALTQQINNANQASSANANASNNANNNPQGGTPNSNIQSILSAANAINKDQSILSASNAINKDSADTATETQSKERKTGGTSLARSKRIGLKNSFTARRPKAHKEATNALTGSIKNTAVEKMNLDEDAVKEETTVKEEAAVDEKSNDVNMNDEDKGQEI